MTEYIEKIARGEEMTGPLSDGNEYREHWIARFEAELQRRGEVAP